MLKYDGKRKLMKRTVIQKFIHIIIIVVATLTVDVIAALNENSFSALNPIEHPLRMETWHLKIRPYPLMSKADFQSELGEEQILVFDDKSSRVEWKQNNALAPVCDNMGNKTSSDVSFTRPSSQSNFEPSIGSNNTSESVTHISKLRRRGIWKISHGNVIWHLPLRFDKYHPAQKKHKNEKTTLHYKATIHLQKFSDKPRMFRGVITRDRYSNSWLPKHWFRPVVATFVASGYGEDTLDLEYQYRDRVNEAAARSAQINLNSADN